jgi:hypothetical protein
MSAVDRVLARLDRPKKQPGGGWMARCKAHHDRNPSLKVDVGDDGRVLFHCHAGCSLEAILAAHGLEMSDLFDREPENRRGRIVATYDYVDEQGALLFQVVRTEGKNFPQRRPDGRGGWIWKLGKTRHVLYRLPRVIEAVASGETIYVAEGEKDVRALESVGVCATTNPGGAGKWRNSYATALRGADVVIVQDRDQAGRDHARKVYESLQGVAASVRIVEAAEGKDASDHLAARLTVDEFRPVPPEDPETPKTGAEPASLRGNAFREADLTAPERPPLADEPDLLAAFRRDLRSAGVAGEQRGAQITLLALTSRVLPWGKPTNRPVSAIGKGSTSTGKSYTQRTVLRFFPPEAYVDLGSMSKKYLLYTGESLAHRFIVVPEWAVVAGDEELVASLRTLLSEGRLVHGTVDGDGRREARLIQKDGPTGLLMTTTASSVDVELETRCLSFLTDDTPEQTRRVFEVLAELEDEDELDVDFDRWHQLQRWIAAGECRVRIPFVRGLAVLMPDGATRLRRDFVSMLCLVRAHAVLHQATRKRDERGRIVATLADYAAVRELLDELVAEAVDATVSAATRETVQAARDLLDEDGGKHVSVKKIADRLGIGKSATYDRVRRATAAGFLANLAKKDERGWKVALGAELPSGGSFLPSPEEVSRVDSDRLTGNENGSTMPEPDDLSALPAFPADPPRNDNELDTLDEQRDLNAEPEDTDELS